MNLRMMFDGYLLPIGSEIWFECAEDLLHRVDDQVVPCCILNI